MMNELQAKAIMRSIGWLAGEQSSIQDGVLSNSRLRMFKSGEYVFHLDDDPGGIFGVIDGGFGVYLRSAGTRMVLSEVLRQGVWFGTGPALSARRRVLSFRAVEPSHAFHLPLPAIRRLALENPAFQSRLGTLSDQNFASPIRVVGDLLVPMTENRVAATLLRISQSQYDPPGHHPWTIRLSQSEIAEMSNASRDRVNRALTKFEARNWIKVEYKAIRILDPSALHVFAYERDMDD
jgi:CRP-like cAMP-binding protein